MLDVLALEPWMGGSHARFLESWQTRSRHRVVIEGLAPRHWKWRMEASAWELGRKLANRQRPDVLFASDYVDLARLVGFLPPDWGDVPRVYYMHENQLTYPVRTTQGASHDSLARDLSFGFQNVLSCIASDLVVFNSAFHRDSFGAAARDMLRAMPRPNPRRELEAALARSSVVHPGVAWEDIPLGPGGEPGAPLRVQACAATATATARPPTSSTPSSWRRSPWVSPFPSSRRPPAATSMAPGRSRSSTPSRSRRQRWESRCSRSVRRTARDDLITSRQCSSMRGGRACASGRARMAVMTPGNVYQRLTHAMNHGALRAVLSSGQAVVMHRLAIMSKDGDWILREEEEALEFVLGVLARQGARYRFGAPLDARWMAGGWSAHFEFQENGLRVRTDFVTRPPRVPAAELEAMWREAAARGTRVPFVDAPMLAALKATNREKDYAVIGELARIMPSPRDQLRFSRSARDLIQLASQHPALVAELARERPVLLEIEQGRDALESALDAERRMAMRANEARLEGYMAAARPWRERWATLVGELRDLPLRAAHSRVVEEASQLLPTIALDANP